MKFQNAVSFCFERTLRTCRGGVNVINSYEKEEIAEITLERSAFHFCQVQRQQYFAIFCCLCPLQRYFDVSIL